MEKIARSYTNLNFAYTGSNKKYVIAHSVQYLKAFFYIKLIFFRSFHCLAYVRDV